jgi:hypothetical protein
MKKFSMMAMVALMSLGLASCAKENGGQTVENTRLMVKINNQPLKTRAIAAGVADGYKTPLVDGKIFIFRDGNLVTTETLNVAQAQGAGQVIEDVPATAEVFVVGNVAANGLTINPAAGSTWGDFTALFGAVTAQQDASKTVLANTGREPKAIESVNTTTGTAEVHVNMAPVVSRIQLAKVTGKTEDGLTNLQYSVTGVYVGNYYPEFTYTGGNHGTMFKAFADGVTHGGLAIYQDAVEVATTAGVAQTSGKSWGYNVASGNVPCLIVKIKLLSAYTIGGVNYTSGDEMFLTVGGYKKSSDGSAIESFEPGVIYNVKDLAFNMGQLTQEPIDNVALTLTVEVDAWSYVDVDGVIL